MFQRKYFLFWGLFCASLVALIPWTLAHSSVYPAFFGRYSRSYLLIIFLHLAAVGGGFSLLLLAWRQPERLREWCMDRFVWFWLGLWALGLLVCVYVAWRMEDSHFVRLFQVGFFGGVLGLSVGGRLPGKRRVWLKKVTLFFLSLVFSVALVEGVFRLLPVGGEGFEKYFAARLKWLEGRVVGADMASHYDSLLELDAELGYRPRPNMQVQMPGFYEDSAAFQYQTDAWGFHNMNLAPERDYKAAVIGDSFAYSMWSEVLSEVAGGAVANLSVPAYSPPQYTIVLRRYAMQLRPSVVLYCLYVNDGLESASFRRWQESGLDWFSFKGGLFFGPAETHKGQSLLLYYLLRVSKLAAFFDYQWHLRDESSEWEAAKPLVGQAEGYNVVFDRNMYMVFSNLENPDVREGTEIVFDSVEEAQRICDEHAVRFGVLLFPPKELVHRDLLLDVVPEEERLEVQNLAGYYAFLAGQLRERGIWVRDMTSSFRGESRRTGKRLYREVDIHWDKAGTLFAIEKVNQARLDLLAGKPGDLLQVEKKKSLSEDKDSL